MKESIGNLRRILFVILAILWAPLELLFRSKHGATGVGCYIVNKIFK